MIRRILFTVTSVILFSGLTLSTRAAAQPFVRSDVPDRSGVGGPIAPANDDNLVNQVYSSWTLGGGRLYWALDCGSPPAMAPAGSGYLRRKVPIPQPKFTVIMATSSTNTCGFDWMTADESGLYYFNPELDRIERRTIYSPFSAMGVYSTASASGPLLRMALDDIYVYWIGGDHQIYFAPKEGGAALTIETTNATPTALIARSEANGRFVYWLDDTGLWKAQNCGIFLCPKTQLSTTPGRGLIYYDAASSFTHHNFLHWFNGASIYSYGCDTLAPFTCSTDTFYTADTSATNWRIGSIGGGNNALYWMENYDVCVGPICFPSGEGKLRRKPIGPIGTLDTISENLNYYGTTLATDTRYAYHGDSPVINRTPLDAPAIKHDLSIVNWEVTQAIQSVNNDVPLSANKPTYVRVYGHEATGTNVNSVDAWLYGQRNGADLPGSPLKSINGLQTLSMSKTPDRVRLNDGWLFQLPAGWTDAGAINLRVRLDPRGTYDDPNPADDERQASFTFTKKAPVCLVTIPVRTKDQNNPSLIPSNTDQSLYAMIDVAKRLMPLREVWLYHQDDPVEHLIPRFGLPPWTYTGYRIPEDAGAVMNALKQREIFSDDPDECDDINAVTHYVGLIHANTNTTSNGTTNLGRGEKPGDVFYTKLRMPAQLNTRPDWSLQAFDTLAHEASHNYNRKHVNCGGPADPDPGYPYPPCQIDNAGQDKHYGFDVKTLTPIAPAAAADYMAYQAPFWVSDYTYKALFNALANNRPTQINAPDLAASVNVVVASGLITPGSSLGQLDPIFVVPTATLSLRTLNKWQALAAPSLSTAPAITPTYHLRLLASNASLIDDRAIAFTAHSDLDALANNFMLTFPAPITPVARLELMQDNAVLASLQPGSHVPVVNILQPTPGQTFSQTMTIVWQATDADSGDQLFYNLQYSSDNGQTWRVLVSQYPTLSASPQQTLTLTSLASLKATNGQGLIRLAASDGYHTSLTMSVPFSITNHAPEPYITSPSLDQTLTPDQLLVLRGGASDTEDGNLAGNFLHWSIDGVDTGGGSDLAFAGLAPGQHTVALTARDFADLPSTVSTHFNVNVLQVPLSSTVPIMDGDCDDPIYAPAPLLQLEPYADGVRGAARLALTDHDLWICFSNLASSSTDAASFVTVQVDVNNSRDPIAQPDDAFFQVGEDGTILATVMADQVSAYVTGNDTAWSAELRVPISAVGGIHHLAGLDLVHTLGSSDRHHWPYRANDGRPDTWGLTLLDKWPYRRFLPIVLR